MTHLWTDSGLRNVCGADPKPARRVKADKAGWERIREEKINGRSCRVCVAFLAATAHHLVPRSLGGDDVEDNLVGLCGSGTTGCHGLVEARDPWACSLLGLRLEPAERDYVIGKKGADFLARYYGCKDVAA